jgi:hypothetical protein
MQIVKGAMVDRITENGDKNEGLINSIPGF